MLVQASLLVEVQILAYLVPMTIAMQVGTYFFYQYHKAREARLKLNRVLLSYGTFTLLMVWGAFLLVIRRVLSLNDETGDMLFTVGFVLVCATPIGFMGFITIKDLSAIMHVGRARVLLATSIIPIIVLLVAGSKSPLFPPSIALTAVNAIYLVRFQVKMIKVALGKLRRKLVQLFTGEMVALTSLLFAANATFGFITFLPSELSFFIAVGQLTAGFLLLFVASIDFPPFYEFDWKLNLSRLYVVDARDYSFLFVHDFDTRAHADKVGERETLFSGAISGIEEMLSFVTGASGRGQIKKIEQGASTILVEHGSKEEIPILFILVVKKDLDSMATFLVNVRRQFEAYFSDILFHFDTMNLSGDGKGKMTMFDSFEILVNNMVA